MKVLAILSEKGGAGKTTVAVHLAVAAKLAGLDVAIIDLDPQASAADWSDRRGSEPEAVAIPPARLEKLLSDLRANDADLAIIDTGRDSNNAGYTAARLSRPGEGAGAREAGADAKYARSLPRRRQTPGVPGRSLIMPR